MSEQTKEQSAKAGTIEPIAVSLEDLDVKPKDAGEGLSTWLGADSSEVTPRGPGGPEEPTPGRRGPGRPKKVAEAVPVKRGPGRPAKTVAPEVAKRGPGRPKGKPGLPRMVQAEASKAKRGRKPAEGGGLLKDYIKRDEAQRLAQDAAERAAAGVYTKLPKLIGKELRKLLK